MNDLFNRTDAYIEQLLVPHDPALDQAVQHAQGAGLPAIQVSPAQGKLLYLLARVAGARRILEIGTLGGFSSIWLARALPEDGELVTLELDPEHARVARDNLDRAGVGGRVRVVVGAASETLPTLAAPFDLVFIDADKQSYTTYLDWAIRLCRPGALIIADNVIRGGEVLEPENHDDAARGVHAFNEAIARDPRVEAIITQIVGSKGHDGIALVRVNDR